MAQLDYTVPALGSTDWGTALNEILEEIKSAFNALEASAATAEMLAGKANTGMDNVTTTGKAAINNFSAPNFSAVVSISSGYTAPKDGWGLVTISSDWGSPTNVGFAYVNGRNVANNTHTAGGSGKGHSNTFMFRVGKGQQITFTSYVSSPLFVPCIGG